MATAEAIKNSLYDEGRTFSGLRYSTLIVISFVLMILALLYVWSHIHMTQLEYKVAAELGKKDDLLEDQRKLKLEYATLKSPRRIEAIAKNTLQMSYPDREQVIFIK
jgi:cell division protein FtsL